jgi:hypothetical protein
MAENGEKLKIGVGEEKSEPVAGGVLDVNVGIPRKTKTGEEEAGLVLV